MNLQINMRTVMIGLLVLSVFSLLAVLISVVSDPSASGPIFLALINLNLIFTVLFLGFITYKFIHLLIERKRGLIGTRLHLRLVAIFSAFTLVPAVVVGVGATWMLNQGIEGWFSDRVNAALNGSLHVAEGYLYENEENLRLKTELLAADPVISYPGFLTDPKTLQQALVHERQNQFLSDLRVYDRTGHLVAGTSERDFIALLPLELQEFMRAPHTDSIVSSDLSDKQMHAITKINEDFFLVASQWVDAAVVARVDQTKAAFKEYDDLQQNRIEVRWVFLLSFMMVACAVLAVSIWVGLKLAQRISQPVVSLVNATNQVSQGHFDMRLTPLDDDELGVLTQSFNRMTMQLKDKQILLENKNKEMAERRRINEAVLSGVSSGVMSFDGAGTIVMVNKIAEDTLGVMSGKSILSYTPLEEMRRDVMANPQPMIEKQLKLTCTEHDEEKEKTFLVRMVPQMSTGGRVRSIVVTFHDITAAMQTQKLTAWSDVAQRIAHEIKNPLTPIQLSTERLKRRYGKNLTDDDKVLFEQLTSTIVRQVEDMRSMINEFSDFARMPAAKMQPEKLLDILKEVVLLQKEARHDVTFDVAWPDGEVMVKGDRSQISRVFTNIFENAVNAIQERDEKNEPGCIKIVVDLSQRDKIVTTVCDNGRGLPDDVASDNLFDPYVTTRKKGTGLGLAIVKRVMDEHGGFIKLMRRQDVRGTMVEVTFPMYHMD